MLCILLQTTAKQAKKIIKKEKNSDFFSFIHPINHAPLSKNDHPHAYKSASSESMNAQAKSAPI